MYISDVSRTSDKYCRDAIKDVNYEIGRAHV